MQRLLFILTLLPSAALAHPSLVPHDHPHGPSLLPDLASIGIGVLVVAGVWLVARRVWRE